MPKRFADETGASNVGPQSCDATSVALISAGDYSCTNKRLHLETSHQNISEVLKQSSDLHRLYSNQPLLDVTNDCATVYSEGMDGSHDGPLKLDKYADRSMSRYYQNSTLAREASVRHLVRTVSDLPVFVTIEDFRVASYSINGEPHLCLPQLLQYIQQKFPLEGLVAKFEETVTNFVSATPKQIEGFVKASALPRDVKTCPLIKRSDAEWVCLALYDQYSKGKEESVVDLSSDLKSVDKNRTDSPTAGDEGTHSEGVSNKAAINAASSLASPSVSPASQQLKDDVDLNNKESRKILIQNDGQSPVLSEHDLPSNTHKDDNKSNISELSIKDQEKLLLSSSSPPPCSRDGAEQNKSSSPIEGQVSNTEAKEKVVVESEDKRVGKQNLFESEAQNSILNLARAATSTLIIQVYHRCFGKCVGLYYPSFMKDPESECIECSSCHKILSPRRFIGHTHGAKELNVCHWGFNSYHWRHYIRLSKKQTMNNLDDDELLVKFNLLKSVSDKKIIDVDVLDGDDDLDKSATRGEVLSPRSTCPSQIDSMDRGSRHLQPGPSGCQTKQSSSSNNNNNKSGGNMRIMKPPTASRHNDTTSTPLSLRPIEEMTNFLITCNSNLLADQANLSRFSHAPGSRYNSPYPWPTYTRPSTPPQPASSASTSSSSSSSATTAAAAAVAAAAVAARKAYQSSVPSLATTFPLLDASVSRSLFTTSSSSHSLQVPSTSNYRNHLQYHQQHLQSSPPPQPPPPPLSLPPPQPEHRLSFPSLNLSSLNYLNHLRGGNFNEATTPTSAGVYTPMTPTTSGAPTLVGTRETTETLIKRDLFIISSLSEFLGSKGLPSTLTDDIVAHTLNSVRRSRSLF